MDLSDPRALADHAATLDCIHCGLCLRTCPTYQLTGNEASSPRGRIHLMRAVAEERAAPDAEFAEEMDFCLVCRNCESVCPAGVRFGEMMTHTRDALERRGDRPALGRLARRTGLRGVLTRRWALSLAARGLRLAQRTGLLRLVARLGGARGRALLDLPVVPPARERAPLPARTEATGEQQAEVALLEGCVMPELMGRVNRATASSLAALGVASRTAPGHVCCGALHAHNGDLDGARDLARSTIEAYEPLRAKDGEPLPLVVNSAGCGAHLRELDHLFADDAEWAQRARALAARVVDYSEAAAPRLEGAGADLPAGSVAGPVVWDDPCHLCHGQGVRAEPRAALDALGGLERAELDEPESCCGSAGIYSILRPADSAAILDERLDALERSGARTLVTANPGCQLQWSAGVKRRGLDVEVLHLAEVVDRALR
jgi:glycolate oxidase iron-sulfur subunit